ncbi:hypothetical protein HETIRDRAFT_103301 [Heterobasidion irregulare TC 32-1]|uniref:Uncharacterized protein n=1 Tax=Heterobasidion irregulare (strain TC 32-1) TaxID=747525 RepID=W4K588_HETIT|nr:uncharacterized protein HETIRDRAFT_103301 [Heterobasidion irregulare TC 32-1]ETW80206.1 hypothetical protein HETIRDRAFT_103301 [Heterobasidion irregulare TC 32-1]
MSSFYGAYIPCLRPYPFTDRPHSTTSPSHDAGPLPRDYPISILRISEGNYVGTDGTGYLVSRVPPYTALLLPSSPLSATRISDSRTDDTLAGRPSSPIFLSTSAPSAAHSLRPHAHYTSPPRLVLHRTLGLARLPPAPSPDSRRLPLTARALYPLPDSRRSLRRHARRKSRPHISQARGVCLLPSPAIPCLPAHRSVVSSQRAPAPSDDTHPLPLTTCARTLPLMTRALCLSSDSRRLPLTIRASTDSPPHTPADDTRPLSHAHDSVAHPHDVRANPPPPYIIPHRQLPPPLVVRPPIFSRSLVTPPATRLCPAHSCPLRQRACEPAYSIPRPSTPTSLSTTDPSAVLLLDPSSANTLCVPDSCALERHACGSSTWLLRPFSCGPCVGHLPHPSTTSL